MTSLKQKIRQLAQDYKLVKFIQEGGNLEAFSNFIKKEELVPVDDVCGLLDEAFQELDKKAFRYHNNPIRLVKFEDIRIVLSGKNE